ncbi:beta-sandwich domain-containing protein [Bdellovibrio sp. BCCA]|uniref:beta-sandwich domain-containing protein n=1 Tax=Bdellovibrio sp. BCCA TaxID=3136281 RepID=UPI0030F0B9F2
MKRSAISTFLAALTLMQTAHAQVLSDLPDFDGANQELPAIPATPVVTEPVQSQYAGSVAISEISRKSGGTLYKIDLQQPLSLLRLDLRVTNSQLKIHQATLVTENGQRIDVREYRNTAVLPTGSVTASENLNLSDRVISIEILAESYSAEADVMLTAIADRGVPKLALRIERSPVVPQRPDVPNRPQTPDRPPVYVDTRISAGDVVLSGPLRENKYYTGRVVEVYRNNQALVRDDDDGKTYVRDLTLLGKRITCESSKNICERASVLSGPFTDNKYYYGSVVDVYSNGKIRVRDNDDGKVYVRIAKDIHVSVRCDSSGNCVGDKVLSGPFTNNKYYSGRIEGVYSNGLLNVRDDDDGKSYLRLANVVMKSVRCEGNKGICVGDRVVSGPYRNGAYYAGRVLGVYSSGIILVQDDDDGKVYPRKAQEISKTR